MQRIDINVSLSNPLASTRSPLCNDGLETENPLTCERIFRELASHSCTEDNRRKEGEALAERIISLAGGLIFIIRWDREETKAGDFRLRWEKSREKGSGKRERRISELKTEKTVEVEKGWLKGLGRVEILSASRVVARTRIYIHTHTYTSARAEKMRSS